jgi:NNP family nitrate/nitrite transporter-like MFS transporter
MKGFGNVQETLAMLGVLVTLSALCALAVRFSSEHKAQEAVLRADALGANNSIAN